jgi:hypothetical protein
MDVQINEVSTDVDVRDAAALLDPRILARIVAEVKRQLEEEDRLRAQRASDRSADVRGSARWST